MKTNFFLIIAGLLFNAKAVAQLYDPSPYCIPGYVSVPCNMPGASNAANNTTNDFIHNFITFGGNPNISNLNSGCNGQAYDYVYNCNQSLGVTAGQVITCSVQSGNTFSQGIAIFIDWNKNHIYNQPSEIAGFTSNAPAGGAWSTINFTVPSNQADGVYRMRVRSVRNINGNNIDPCNGYLAGETEEYNVFVNTPIPSVASATAVSNTPICINQSLSLTVNYTGTGNVTFGWTGPNSFTSNLQSPVIPNAGANAAGLYSVNVLGTQCPVSAAVNVGVGPNQAANIQVVNSHTALCIGDTATLTASGAANYTWNPPGILGGSGPTIQVCPAQTTTYVVSSNDGTCVASTPITVTVGCVGIKTNTLPENISVYPNPFKNELFIKVNHKTDYVLFNSLGEAILKKTISVQEIINTEFLPRGVYYLSVTGAQGNGMVKVVKN